MTTSEDRAQRIVGGVIDRLTVDKSGVPVATRITQALADAGLLMPCMPRPMQVITSDWAKFNEHIEVIDGNVRVYFAGDFGEDPETLTPAEAREQAIELHAAANYAEQEQSNG